MNNFQRALVSEWLGTMFLLAAVVGSGIMAENLAAGNMAIALLGNTIPTGAILVVLITILGPISGAHLNPAVTIAFLLATIFGTLRWQAKAVSMMVGLYITAAYWFIASTSFANPAVTVARSFTNTFSGIFPGHALGFIVAQLAAAVIGAYALRWLFSPTR